MIFLLTCFILDSNSLSDIDCAINALPFGDGERHRLLALGSCARRRESVCALLCLEALLGRLGLSAGEIKRETGGRPYFDAPSCVDFSLSHSGGLCLAAVSDIVGNRVGADIEIICRGKRVHELAARFFSEEERERLKSTADTQKAFFEAWVRKEAAAKLSGGGLASILSQDIEPHTAHSEFLPLGDKEAVLCVCSNYENEPLEIFFNGEKL